MTDETSMRVALDLAIRANTLGEVPVGAIVVIDEEVVAQAHNQTIAERSALAHAELIVLHQAIRQIGDRYLPTAELFVTLEPCAMCAGAIVLTRIRRLVFAARDPKAGVCGSLYNLCADPRLNHEVEVVPDILASESSTLLQSFFQRRRPG
ncbi:MAG: tRNA adenosine(34) deaminase TadA [Ferrimicrobium sp.]|jgi:tRNA(adenine34) deaminase|uniref:tRNA-specific adenosine deaminase n=1 Tax=Ferrimicrobium acidiphilum TaxID=121039 RepID=A0ABV3Y3P7_9ACTN|nr:tRNA adenosine(34) deaminase TadA [Ferrimicrobium sp.]